MRFDEPLRTLTRDTAKAARELIASGRTPPPVKTPGCRRCSLASLCQPARFEKPVSVTRWLARQIEA